MQGIKDVLNRMKEAFNASTYKDLADKLGVSQSSIDSWRSRGAVPEKNLLKTSQMCGVSIDWLETGEELKTQDASEHQSGTVIVNYFEDVYASAGYGNINHELQSSKMEFDKNFLENILNIKKFEKLDIIRVVGDSMLPAIRDGEYIIVEREGEARSGDTVIANVDGELYVKRLHKLPFSKYLRLESENSEYPPIALDTDEKLEAFSIIGIVRSKIKLY